MKKAVLFLGTVVASFAILVTIGLMLLEVRNQEFDAQSRAFAEVTAPVLLHHPDRGILSSHAAPPLAADIDQGALDEAIALIEGLGPFIDIDALDGKAYIEFGGEPGQVITAYYEMIARFEEGTAWLRLRLVRRHKRWQLLGMQVAPHATDAAGEAEVAPAKSTG